MLDWVGTALDIGGKYFTARKRVVGFIVYLGSNIAWVVWALPQEIWSLVTLEAVHAVLNIYAIFYWLHKY